MKNELPSLIKLQKMDAEIDELRAQAEAIAPLVQAKTRSIENLKTGVKSTKDRLASHQVKKKQLELDADDKEKQVQKHQSELNSLKSNDAYKVMLSEIQNAKQEVTKIEDDLLVLMEMVEADEKEVKELEKNFKTDEAAVKSEIQELETKKTNLSNEVTKRLGEREDFAKSISPSLRNQYETIREQKGGIAIVPLVNKTSCGGCQMGLTPATVNEVMKAKNMVLCDTCARILYSPSDGERSPSSPTNTQTAHIS